MATERPVPITKIPETPQSTAILFTEEQLQRPWKVIHIDTMLDPENVEKEGRTMLDLAESIFIPKRIRGNTLIALFQIPIYDHSPLEKPGDEPKIRLWELKFTYGNDQKLDMLEMSTGKLLQHFRIRSQTFEISYYGHHTSGDKMVESEKINHPLWIDYGKKKLEELVTAATRTFTEAQRVELIAAGLNPDTTINRIEPKTSDL